MTATVRLQQQRFDAAAEAAALARGRTDVGAVVTFTGICRGDEDGAPIAALTLEHYPGMAEAEIARHVEEAQRRWTLLGVTVIHRHGRIAPGEEIVLVVTASSHRQDAFAAAEFLMDYLKTRAPFWKRVESARGTSRRFTQRPSQMSETSAARASTSSQGSRSAGKRFSALTVVTRSTDASGNEVRSFMQSPSRISSSFMCLA